MAILEAFTSCEATQRIRDILFYTNLSIIPIMSNCATLSTLGMLEYNKSNFEDKFLTRKIIAQEESSCAL